MDGASPCCGARLNSLELEKFQKPGEDAAPKLPGLGNERAGSEQVLTRAGKSNSAGSTNVGSANFESVSVGSGKLDSYGWLHGVVATEISDPSEFVGDGEEVLLVS
jgi:hypothetical protein